MIKRKIPLKAPMILSGLFFLTACVLQAQWETGAWSPGIEDSMEVYEDLFGREEALELTLKCDFRTFKKERFDDKYHPASMTCVVNDSFLVTHPVRLKARGVYRREKCGMPPIWLNIRSSGIDINELSGTRRIKMVSVCRSSEQYSDYLLREYILYKIFNLVTPYSFRVRLVNLTMVDTGKDNKESQSWAFLIEPTGLMAYRLGAEVIKSDELSMKTVNPEAMDILAMFQYMIANPDYSVTGRHNLKILAARTSGPSGFIPVPYDFDFTGFVNANYATPNPQVEIHSLRERYFVGPCRDRLSYENAIAALQAVRDEIESTIWAFDYLDEDSRFDLIGYIESFFNTADHDRFIDRQISTTCK